MKFVGLMLAGAAIFAYVGVEGKPMELSFSAKERIGGKLNKILQILTQEAAHGCETVGDNCLYPPPTNCGPHVPCCCQGLECRENKRDDEMPMMPTCHESP